jgi:lambda repressor-like predicted transcriptional regulator
MGSAEGRRKGEQSGAKNDPATKRGTAEVMNASINVPMIVEAMRKKGWGIRDCCANCGVTGKTLKAILSGKVPKRIDALYRIMDGLEITAQEALANGGTPKTARLYVLPDRRRNPEVA